VSTAVLEQYYAAFNAGDRAAMLALVTDDVVHDANQGDRNVGREAFAGFLARMAAAYRERAVDLVIMVHERGDRAAVELVIEGEYLAAEPGLPPAHGQRYRLPVGQFFSLRDGKIARVTTYYNLPAWLAQVS
jgi:steroid delta-isomerase-like uncharacterized protein